MNALADVDGFKICIQMCVWLRFPPLTPRKERNFFIAIIRIELCLVLFTELVVGRGCTCVKMTSYLNIYSSCIPHSHGYLDHKKIQIYVFSPHGWTGQQLSGNKLTGMHTCYFDMNIVCIELHDLSIPRNETKPFS